MLIIAVPSIFLVVVYGFIGVIVLSRARKLHPDVADSSGGPVAQSPSQHRQAQEKQQQQQQQKYAAGRERRAVRFAVTCAVVTILFLVGPPMLDAHLRDHADLHVRVESLNRMDDLDEPRTDSGLSSLEHESCRLFLCRRSL